MYNYNQRQIESHTTLGIPERWERVLTYLFGWVTGLIFLLVERNPNVRRHAKQSILVFGTLSIVTWLVHAIGGLLGHIILIGWLFGLGFGLLGFVLGVVWFIAWIGLMVLAYMSPHTIFVGPRQKRYV